MLVLLPPSEGKARPASGPAVDLSELAHPELTAVRQRVGNALVKVSAQRNAYDVLGVSAGLADQVTHNQSLWSNPVDYAAKVYSGVLFEAAGTAQWDAATIEFARQHVRVASALWGAVSPACAIPAYRLSIGTSLGRLGPLARLWRPGLDRALGARDDAVVIDCRSAPYAAAWKPAPDRHVSVRVESEHEGKRSVVSHMAKHTRGVLAGRLMTTQTSVTQVVHVADVARELMGPDVLTVEFSSGTTGHILTLVVAS